MSLNRIHHIYNNLKRVTYPFQIGFVQGHYYISDQQVDHVAQTLTQESDSDAVVTEYEQKMTAMIGQGYGTSYAAGRMAFFSILKALNIGHGDEVILLGFTCSVMPNAVLRVGATPVYAGVDEHTFGSCVEAIENNITDRTKLIVAQHSFGIPCDVEAIAKLGKDRGIFVVEDCAITFDSSVKGVRVGNWGDAAIFSTDHSKPINTMVGGFLYTNNQEFFKKVEKASASLEHLDIEHQARLYERFIFERNYYSPKRYPRAVISSHIMGFLKSIRQGSKRPVFLDADYGKPLSDSMSYPYPAKLPPFLAQLGLFELERWQREKERRRQILKNYLNILVDSEFGKYLPVAYHDTDIDIIPLRLAFACPDAKILNKKLSKIIDTGWTWFCDPIICCSDGVESMGYKTGCCKKTESICEQMINLPCVVAEGWDENMYNYLKQVLSVKAKI